MIEITNGVKTLTVPDATAQATLKEKWLKGWTIVKPVGNAPQEVIQFQQAKLKESINVIPEPKCEADLFKLPLAKLEEIADTLSEDQLKGLVQDPRKSVKALAKKQLNKLRSDSRKQEDRPAV